jgi:hypothetical protein
MKIDEIEIDEIEFKIICIKNCEEERQLPRMYLPNKKNRKIKNGQIFTTNNSDFFWFPNVARLYSSDGDYLGLFDNSNFMKLEVYRNFKIEELLN